MAKPTTPPGAKNKAPTAIALNNKTVSENSAEAVIGIIKVSDPDKNETFTFELSDDRFEIVVDSLGNYILQLASGVSFDYESEPTVTLSVTVRDSQGLSKTQNFIISVANVNEAPTAIALSNSSVDENEAGAVIGTLSGSDPENDTLTFSVVGAEAVRFEAVQDAITGEWSLKLKEGISLDHEQGSSVNVTVRAFDGALAFEDEVQIAVKDVSESSFQVGYLNGFSEDYGAEVWAFDGTNLLMLADIFEGFESSHPYGFIEFSNELYFFNSGTFSEARHQLHRLNEDGTVTTVLEPTSAIKNALAKNPGEIIIEFKGDLYFAGYETGSLVLHKISGTDGLATVVEYDGSNLITPDNFFEFDGDLYFRAATAEVGTELFKLSGEDDSITVFDIAAGIEHSVPYGLTEFEGSLYFSAMTPENGMELYALGPDGSLATFDIDPGIGHSAPFALTEFNGSLYFSAGTSEIGRELFKLSDGSLTSFDIASGNQGSSPSEFAVFNGALYFNAWTPETGYELHKLSQSGELSIVDINPEASSSPYEFTEFNGDLYFTAVAPDTGRELHKLSGYDGTVTAIDLLAGPDSSGAWILGVVNGVLGVAADVDNDGGYELLAFTESGYAEITDSSGTFEPMDLMTVVDTQFSWFA